MEQERMAPGVNYGNSMSVAQRDAQLRAQLRAQPQQAFASASTLGYTPGVTNIQQDATPSYIREQQQVAQMMQPSVPNPTAAPAAQPLKTQTAKAPAQRRPMYNTSYANAVGRSANRRSNGVYSFGV